MKGINIIIGAVFFIGLLFLYAAYSLFSIQLHSMFIQAGIVLIIMFLILAAAVFRFGHYLYTHARNL